MFLIQHNTKSFKKVLLFAFLSFVYCSYAVNCRSEVGNSGEIVITCWDDGGSGGGEGGSGGGIGIVGYGCTNCVYMSPSECQSVKSSISSRVNTISGQADSVYNSALTLQSTIDSAKSFYTRFTPHSVTPYTSASSSGRISTTNYVLTSWNNLPSDSPQRTYCSVYYPINLSSGSQNIPYYYQLDTCMAVSYRISELAVSSFDSLSNDVNDVVSSSRSLLSTVQSLEGLSDGINCDSCGSSSSGNGGGSSGGSCSSCESALSAIQSVLTQIDSKVADCRQALYNLRTDTQQIITDFGSRLEHIDDSLSSFMVTVSNGFERVDTYLTQDLSNSLYRTYVVVSNIYGALDFSGITNHLGVISSNVFSIATLVDSSFGWLTNDYNVFSRDDYNWNTYGSDFDGDRHAFLTNRYLAVSDSDGKPSSWFERIELLLASLVFGSDSPGTNVVDGSNSPFGDLDSDVTGLFDGSSSVASSLVDSHSNYFESLVDCCSAFKSWLGNFSSAPTEITLFSISSDDSKKVPAVSVSFNSSVYGNFLNIVRSVSSLVWIFVFFVSLYGVLKYLVVVFSKIFVFVWSVVSSVFGGSGQ